MISTMKARRLLENGCIGFLASVVDISIEQKLKPEEVLIDNEFLEIFLEDLPGLPPE